MVNNLSKYACRDSEAERLIEEESDVRPPFFRDADRIIYSSSFNRYIDKTQVFSFTNNDHVSKRITHVIMVSKISRTIARLLNLNEDLCDAIALGHDAGHTPLGHVGEAILNKIINDATGEAFLHNIQSVREYMTLENDGLGVNLNIQVLDGIMCHNGEVLNNIYSPVKKTKDEFLKEYNEALIKKEVSYKLKPMTLEGCVVRISDVIAYIGKDIEDAIRLNIIKRSDIPKDIVEVLGNTNRDIINNIILDIVDNSRDKPYIKMSDKVFETVEKLKSFNYKNIYYKANTEQAGDYYENAFSALFKKYLKDLKEKNKNSSIYQKFLNNMSNEYIKNTSLERVVVDYIAGMTDDFFISQYKHLVKPI